MALFQTIPGRRSELPHISDEALACHIWDESCRAFQLDAVRGGGLGGVRRFWTLVIGAHDEFVC